MENREKKYGEKKRSTMAVFCFLTALALLLSTAGTTLAKYIMDISNHTVAVAEPFYFTSDKLTAESPSPYFQIEGQAGSDINIVLHLRNYVDDLRITDEDITYTCFLDVDNGIYTEASDGRLLKGSKQDVTLTFTVPGDCLDEASIITVRAVSEKPYEKILGARFGYKESVNAVTYEAEISGNTVLLHFGGGMTGQTATLTWARGLVADTSNPVLENVSGNSGSVPLRSGEVYTITFFMADTSKTYSGSDFTVTVTE